MIDRLKDALDLARARHASSVVAGVAVALYVVLGWWLGAPRDYALAGMVALILIGVPLANEIIDTDE